MARNFGQTKAILAATDQKDLLVNLDECNPIYVRACLCSFSWEYSIQSGYSLKYAALSTILDLKNFIKVDLYGTPVLLRNIRFGRVQSIYLS